MFRHTSPQACLSVRGTNTPQSDSGFSHFDRSTAISLVPMVTEVRKDTLDPIMPDVDGPQHAPGVGQSATRRFA